MQLEPGHSYQIKSLSQGMPRSYRHKLLSMGLIPGSRFYVARVAPFGNTLHIITNGFSLSLRAKELEWLYIEHCEENDYAASSV